MSNSTKRFLYASIVTVISYGFSTLHFILIDKFDRDASDSAHALALAQANTTSAAHFLERIEGVGGLEVIVRSAFVLKGDLVPFIESLETKARSLGLVPEIVSANDSAGTPEQPAILATINVVGSRTAVDTYIRTLATLPYHVVVDSISISKADEGGWVGTATVYAFVLPEDSARDVLQLEQ